MINRSIGRGNFDRCCETVLNRSGLSGLALLFKRGMVIFIPCSQAREAKGNTYVFTLCFLGILHPRRPRGSESGRREKRRDELKFSSTSGRASGYRLSPDHFKTVKRIVAPDWAQKMFCIIVPNRRTASPEFFL